MSQTLVGVYETDWEPWVLIELAYDKIETPVEMQRFALVDKTTSSDNWQVAYDERVLDTAGIREVANGRDIGDHPEVLRGAFRLCFFIYRDRDLPLQTLFESLRISEVQPMPARLEFIEFEEP